ncbi:MAG: RHS repeat-associated core domain-containing protein [Solirubrobacteraceae bacterium]
MDRGPAAGGFPVKSAVFKDLASPPAALAAPRALNAFPKIGSEIASSRTVFSRTFVAQDGGYVARVYSHPVNFRAPDGSMQPIDDTLVAAPGGFATRADSQRVLLPAHASDPVTVSGPEGDVSFSLLGAAATASPAVSGVEGSYASVLPDVSLKYAVAPGLLKEAIVLASTNAPAVLRFSLNLSAGLSPALDRAGNLRITDAKGKVVYSVAAPSMSDANTSLKALAIPSVGRVAVTLTRAAGGWTLELTPDRVYLQSPARKFPVVIDPTLNSTAGTECEIAGGAYTNFNACSYNETPVGSGANMEPIATLVQLPLGNAIPADAQVLGSQLVVNVYQRDFYTTPLTVSAYGLKRSFTANATWNAYDGVNPWQTPGSDHDPTPLSSVSITGAGQQVFPMTALTQSWVNGSRENDGVVLTAPPSSLADNFAFLHSTGPVTYPGTPAGNPSPPYLEIAYLPRLGAPRGAQINTTRLSDRMSLGVNVANGNLLVHNTDLAVSGTGLSQAIDRTYNNLSPNSVDFGHGWSSSAGRTPVIEGYPDGGVLAAADGSDYVFANDGSLGYVTPPGIDATLCSAYTLAGCPGLPAGATFRLAYRSGVSQAFNIAGNLGDLSQTFDQNQNRLSYQLSQPGGAIVKDTDSQGRTLSFTDSGATFGSQTQTITDNAYTGGRHTSYGYTAGNLTSYVDAAGKTTLYGYDGQNNLTQITDPNGNITKLGYDGTGRIASILRVTDPVHMTGDTTTYAYNAPGTVIAGVGHGCPTQSDGSPAYQQTVQTDPKGHTTTYCYDTHDRVYQAYDALGNPRASTFNTNDNVTLFADPSGAKFAATYEKTTERLMNITEPAKTGTPATTSFAYDVKPGHQFFPDTVTDPQSNTTTLGYDANNNVNAVTPPSPATGVTLPRNANGTLASSSDGDGPTHTTTYAYDAAGNLKSFTPPAVTPSLGTPTIGVDTVSRQTSSIDGKSNQTSTTYDAMDRVSRVDFRDASSISYIYDNNGNLTKQTDSLNGVSNYTYDAKNRITQEQLPGQTNGYTYDAADNLLTSASLAGSISYGYDPNNLIASVKDPGSATPIVFTNDMTGNRACTVYPNGVVVNNTYDPAGHLLSTQANAEGLGVAGQTTACGLPATGTALTANSYTYTQGTNNTDVRQTAQTLAGDLTTYTHDAMNRVTQAQTSGPHPDNRTYALDGAGNIMTRTINGTPTNYAYNNANELTTAGATGYTYDQNGNETSNTAGLALTYNARNQTSSITPPGQPTQTLGYLDPSQDTLASFGNTGCPSSATTLAPNLLGTASTTTTTTTSPGCQPAPSTSAYTLDNNGTLLDQRPMTGANSYYLQDGLGSVIGTTDPAGNLINTYTYDPYGQTTTATGPTPNLFGYTQGLQAPAGLIHYGARYYDPATSRWTQQDPLGQPGDPNSANRYAYAGGNPVDFTDPAGLCFILNCNAYHHIGQAALSAFSVADLAAGTASSAALTVAGPLACLAVTAGAGSVACYAIGAFSGAATAGGGYATYHEAKHFYDNFVH